MGSNSLAQTNKINPNYNADLAKKLGADDYGMKKYVLVILKTGSNNSTKKEEVDAAFSGHMENMGKLVKAKKLIVAGPLSKNERNYRGIFILNANSTEEAKEILETDPAIKTGFLAVELYTWYGSAALPEYLPFDEKVGRLKIN